jgi:hypothetical protein
MSVSGTPWKLGAVGAVTWEGVRLADVLDLVGVSPDAVDVMPVGLDPHYVDKGVDYGAVRRPLPIAKAYDDALLAWGMNGHALLPDHGFPLRLVVPGWVGIASIKWLGSLEVSASPLSSPWNTKWYRMTGGDYPVDAPPLTVLPVRSAWELPETAPASSPTDASTSRSRTPSQRTAPTAPSDHWVPAAACPCWAAKKRRPLPVHSWIAVTCVAGSAFSCASVSRTGASAPRGTVRPSPWIVRAYDATSIVGVEVWLRTNSRLAGVR